MYWRVSHDKLLEMDADNRIWWGKNGSNVPAVKRFLSEVLAGIVPQTIWFYKEVGHNQAAKQHLKQLLPDVEDLFVTPKPEGLIERILRIATTEDDWVLDSFAGTGTLGTAAHKMGRRWIIVELGEHCHTHIIPRLQKVIDGEDAGGIPKAVLRNCEWDRDDYSLEVSALPAAPTEEEKQAEAIGELPLFAREGET